ncbi:hypothetical protein XELAEV_18040141mg [Xenopus laevis]|uniref:WAP four-disulfide core domain protein 5 n=1 Tax=Xenopus laevis TaxID=8355 RepID=A0A974H8I7_XENLA|nr:hypothetical protein XELAEV_18040141mg [Xenopus laevis]
MRTPYGLLLTAIITTVFLHSPGFVTGIPVDWASRTQYNNQGECPPSPAKVNCWNTIRYRCNSDSDCNRDQKCCYRGCEKLCVSATLGGMGFPPLPPAKPTYYMEPIPVEPFIPIMTKNPIKNRIDLPPIWVPYPLPPADR